MPSQTAVRTRHGARPRPRPAPARAAARRVSGPLRPAPAGGGVVRRGTTGVFERIRALPETRFMDGLLRGRAWIWLIGLLLGGIVAMQVSLLKLNAGISRAVTASATLERQNAALEAGIARLSSGDRVRAAATEEGMVQPLPGGVEYLTARGDKDATRAAKRMQPPSEHAATVMENGGREPGVLAAPLTTEPTAATATTDPAAVPSADSAAVPSADSAAVPSADPAAVAPADPAAVAPADPAATEAPPPAVDPTTGAAAVPGQG